MFSIFKDMVKNKRKSGRKYEPTQIQVIPKEDETNHLERFYLSPEKLESIKEEKNSKKTLKSFGITDDEISNLKNAKKTDISKAINNAEMDESMRGFLHKFLVD